MRLGEVGWSGVGCSAVERGGVRLRVRAGVLLSWQGCELSWGWCVVAELSWLGCELSWQGCELTELNWWAGVLLSWLQNE